MTAFSICQDFYYVGVTTAVDCYVYHITLEAIVTTSVIATIISIITSIVVSPVIVTISIITVAIISIVTTSIIVATVVIPVITSIIITAIVISIISSIVIVVLILDLVITGAIPKWAIFAPIFVPLLMRLGVEPDAVLAAYRVGDSPMNAITPLNAYFALIVTFAQRYQKESGVGTVIALMLPYIAVLCVVWTLFFALWHVFGLPWGL